MNKINNLLIIITHFNNDSTLLRCVKSALKIVNGSDILLVDDCSSQLSFRRIIKIIDQYNINLIKLDKNYGVSYARNIGIDYSITHNYFAVTFLDADDFFVANKFELNLNNDISIYNSLELLDGSDSLDVNEYKVIKINDHNNENLTLLLEKYIKTPNKVPTLTSCWAKIYNTKLLEKYKIKFNTKMKTFEDVDFLFNYLIFCENVNFNNEAIYAHTNKSNLNSLTFGYLQNRNSMFGFLQSSRTLRTLLKINHPNIKFNLNHLLACYYSITFIRMFANKNLLDILNNYFFIKKRLKSNYLIKCFKGYDVLVAGGNKEIKDLVIKRSIIQLTFALSKFAKKRYG